MPKDIVEQRSGGKILGIATYDFLLVVAVIGKEDEVVQHLHQSLLAKQSVYHRQQRVDAVAALVGLLYLSPGIEELVGREQRTKLIVHAIADYHKSVELEQLWYVLSIAHSQLFIGILDGGIFLDGALELHHHHGQTVYIDDGIGPAQFLALNLQLVHQTENVTAGFVEVYEVDEERNLCRVFTLDGEAIHQVAHHLTVVLIQRTHLALYLLGGRLHLYVRNAFPFVLSLQEVHKVIAQEHVALLTHDVATGCVLIILLPEQVDDGLF